MIKNFSQQNTIINKYLSELRDVNTQQDRLRFRHNLERIGELMAYEISKTLDYEELETETPLGNAITNVPADRIVLATILRAGLPMHQGFLRIFDAADNAFISAFRKYGKGGDFEVQMEYVSAPDLDDAVLIVIDPMLATGASMDITLQELHKLGTPKATHIATAVASTEGIEYIKRLHAKAHIWAAGIDDEMTAKAYIVPGLGDAGDLAFGPKIHD